MVVVPTVYGDFHYDVPKHKLVKQTDTERKFFEPAMRQEPSTPVVQYTRGGTAFALRPGFYTGSSEIVREPGEVIVTVKQSVRPTTWRLAPDGKHLYVAMPDVGFKDVRSDLVQVDTETKVQIKIAPIGDFISLLYLSADESQAAVVTEEEWRRRERISGKETYEYRYSARLINIAKRTVTEKIIWREKRKGGLPLAPDAFHFSPSLSRLAFRYPLSDGRVAIRVIDVETEKHEDVYVSPGHQVGPGALVGPIEWSPDERQLLFPMAVEGERTVALSAATPDEGILLLDIPGRRATLEIEPKPGAAARDEVIKLVRGSFDGKGFVFSRGKQKSDGADKIFFVDTVARKQFEISSEANTANVNHLYGASYY
jgi:hypothetical protein